MQSLFSLLERNQSLIDGIANNDRRVKEVEKARSKRAGLPRRKNFHSGAVEGCKTRVGGTKNARQARPAEEVPVIGRLMSRSKKRHLEWTFFLDENGRRQYNKLCKGCVHPCKQSFRAVVVSCPHYLSLRSKKCGNQGLKWVKKQPVSTFLCRGSMIFYVGWQGVSAQEKRQILPFQFSQPSVAFFYLRQNV